MRIVERFSRPWLLSVKYIYQRLRRCPDQTRYRVFVAGMQRSGTNMLMDVLERNFETDVYHERDPRAFVNYQMRSLAEIEALVESSPARVFVIKALCELQDLTSLMDKLAPAKTIWIVRHYNDVVNSMLRSFSNMGQQVQRIVNDRDSSGWIGRGISGETHAVLKNLVPTSLDDNTASALQWYIRNVLFFDQSFDTDDRVMLVSYEKLASKPADEFERIFRFTGINYSPRVARKVSPRSIGKNSPPEIDPAVRDLCDGLFDRFQMLM